MEYNVVIVEQNATDSNRNDEPIAKNGKYQKSYTKETASRPQQAS